MHVETHATMVHSTAQALVDQSEKLHAAMR